MSNEQAGISLESVISTPDLQHRATRETDVDGENRALLELARHLSEKPADILQKLSEIAVELCHAGSAGVSIVEEEGDVFRWYGTAGELAGLRWATLPRSFSPCGTVVDTAVVQLMTLPERHFDYISEITPTVEEVLLIPFAVDGDIVGTVWIASHDPHKGFDREDVRLITNLTAFAAAGFKTQKVLKAQEDAIRNRDEFLAILGHELRNPLSPMVAVHRLLSAKTVHDSTRWTAVDVIGRQLAHMQRLVDDLLDVSRIAEGKLSITKVPVDIVGLIREAIESAAFNAEKATLVMGATLPAEPIYVNADPSRIIQIVTNLLNNAIKFTSAKGRIDVKIQSSEKHVFISVKDTGIGLAPKSMKTIFSMFNQVDGQSQNNKGGLGIGLGLAKTLTELHDGTIGVKSAGLNQGCEFTIQLPLLGVFKRSTPNTRDAQTELPVSGLRILIADDNHDCADSLGMLLSVQGYKTHIAYDGLDAVAQAITWKPHVILLDLSLAGLNGYEVVEKLRSNAATQHTFIVAITGYGTDADRARTKEIGFDIHMTKPIDPDALYDLLASRSIYEGAERRMAASRGYSPERRRVTP